MAGATRILVVRHGESEWNATGRWQGHADPPLSDRGEQQARAAADRLGAVGAIIASDLQRAAVTAVLISQSLGVGPVIVDGRLRERDVGEWEGLTRQEIDEQFPGFLANGSRPPGFETPESLFDRVYPCLIDLARTHPGDSVLAVSHAGVLYALETHLDLPRQALPNLSGRWFEVRDAALHAGERVLLVDPHDVPLTTPRSE
jgi:broad specificity phosphatase PhoE